jgi:hypothetical protein
VDFNSFEFRILCSEAGIEAPSGDCAAYIAHKTCFDRKQVKRILNAMLHFQTIRHLSGAGDRLGLQCRQKVESLLRAEWPALIDKLESLRDDPDFLQRRGAEIFLSFYADALREESLPGGIPMHDGWIFPAKDEAQVRRVSRIFAKSGGAMLGQKALVKHEVFTT